MGWLFSLQPFAGRLKHELPLRPHHAWVQVTAGVREASRGGSSLADVPVSERVLPSATLVLDGDGLNCVGLQLSTFPLWAAQQYATITRLDLSGGSLQNLQALEASRARPRQPYCAGDWETVSVCCVGYILNPSRPPTPKACESLETLVCDRCTFGSL